MPSIEKLEFKNKIIATLKNAQTGEVINTITTPNTITNTGEELVLDAMGLGDRYIKHCAIGTGGASTSAGTILLTTEINRGASIYTRAGQVGTFSTFFNTAQANSGPIIEIGFFGGTSSFTSTNTGTIFNRIILSSGITKTSNYTLTIDLDCSF